MAKKEKKEKGTPARVTITYEWDDTEGLGVRSRTMTLTKQQFHILVECAHSRKQLLDPKWLEKEKRWETNLEAAARQDKWVQEWFAEHGEAYMLLLKMLHKLDT